MNNELVSIIIPFYRGEKHIENAIDSIIKQTYQNFEVLLIENGPKDLSEQIISRYNDNRLKYHYIREGNVSNARNFGMKIAKGKYIYFMDGDDTINNNLLELCVSTLNKQKVDLVMFNFNKVSKDSTSKVTLPWSNMILNKKRIQDELIPPMVSVEKGEKSIMGTVWRIFTYKDKIEKFEFDKNIKIAEDMLFCIKVFNSIDNIYVLNDTLYNYTLSSSSTLNTSKLDVIYQSITYHKILKRILIEEGLYNKEMERRFYKNQGRMYTTAISYASRNKNKELAQSSIYNIIKIYKSDNYNYFKLNYPTSIKISFLMMELKMTHPLYYI